MSKRDLFAPFRAAYKAEAEKHNGPKYWRSVAHKSSDPVVVADLDVEFPSGTAPLPELQRRDVLKLAGASLALAGLSTACIRRPEEEILPYTHQPEEVLPGVATHYATVQPRSTGALGLVVTAYEGRPQKIEGNTLHASSGGAADIWAQAEVIRLFDPDRSRAPRKGMNAGHGANHGEAASWADFDAFAKTHFASFDATGGKGLAFVVDGADKPTVKRLLAKAKAKWANAGIYSWDPTSPDRALEGAELAFGPGARVHHDLEKASVILALDSDFLVTGPDAVKYARAFGTNRRIYQREEASRMSRLYAVEGNFTTTGATADHRLRVPSSQIPAFLQAVGAELAKAGVSLGALPTGAAPAGTEKFVAAVAKDLAANKGKAVLLVGEAQPAAVHAYAAAVNVALGAQDSGLQTVTIEDGATSSASRSASVKALAAELNAGAIDTVVIVDVNLAHTAPGALKLKDGLKKAKHVIVAGLMADETAQLSTWHLPLAHFLESWGDARSFDGTPGIVQPLILPIFGARSEVALLGGIVEGSTDDRALVEATWQEANVTGKAWRKALHDGVFTAGGPGARSVSTAAPKLDAIAGADFKLPTGAIEITLTFGPVLDGRFGNSPWNQELPDFMTKLCWDNALVISPALAHEMGIASQVKRNGYESDVVTITVDGRTVEAPTFVLPGLPKGSAFLNLGYGRSTGGVASGVGVDGYSLMGENGGRYVAGAIQKANKKIELCSTQDHFNTPADPFEEVTFAQASGKAAGDKLRTLELGQGRQTHIREGKLKIYQEHGATPRTKRRGDQAAPESEFAHAGDIPENLVAHSKNPPQRPVEPIQPTTPITYDGQQWGMVIDLTACTGCNACVVACQAENNIINVGREQVLLGREMHWLRIDRYFSGDVDNPVAYHQPINCMHCEQAPCESVCPVAATVHDEEGINSMAYNRCIGTRYCANNCPYKVRRYNYLDWSMSANIHRDPVKNARFDIYKLQRNPNVTVRYRGVMEKCTYCTQRIEAAKVAEKIKGGDRKAVPDGAVVPACAQTCPTQAITFGNINDEKSKVHALKKSDRNYEMLQELNVRPRTTFLAKLKNTNPELEG
jgi:MoCo/4Fe-4S cofactor protein with predicted Tat translocation signal